MTVFVVLAYEPSRHPGEICGVYSSEEAAQGYIDQQDYADRAYLEIEQWEVED